MFDDDQIHDNERDFWSSEPTSRLARIPRLTPERARRHGDTPPRGTPRVHGITPAHGTPRVVVDPSLQRPVTSRLPTSRLQLVPAQLAAFDPFGDLDEVDAPVAPADEADLELTFDHHRSGGGRLRRADPFLVRIGLMLALGMVAIVLVWAVSGASADEPAPTPATTTPPPAQVEVAPPPSAGDAAAALGGTQNGPSRLPHTTATSGVASSPARRPSCTGTSYTVGRGDGWIAIAKKVGVTTKQLLAANGATAKTVIHPGRTICLPAGATAPTTSAPNAAPSSKGTTTPKPPSTTAPAPSTTIVVKTYTAAEVEAIIRQVWPDDLEDEAVRIATRESNLKPSAKNSCCYGLFQIYYGVHKSWLQGLGVTSAGQLLDPTVNANAAYALYQRSGSFAPWN